MFESGLIFLLSQVALIAAPAPPNVIQGEDTVGIENAYCRILFDRRQGALLSITNLPLRDECLKNAEAGTSPFRVYLDPVKEYELGEDPGAICKTTVGAAGCRLKEVHTEKGLNLTYESEGLEMTVNIALQNDSGTSDWAFTVKNTSGQPRTMLPSFPCFGGIGLGADPAGNWATVLNQAGNTGPAWEYPGGVCGNGGQMSMQWHAIWDPAARSALGVLFMDPGAKAKRLLLRKPNLELSYFPPVTLEAGASLHLPPARLLVYAGDWRPAARAYAAWYDTAYTHAPAPKWFQDSDGCEGRHLKKGGPGVVADYDTQFVLDSFRDMPRAHQRLPIDNMEYAFYSRGSMLHGIHTDGDNLVREDMGGAEAMREGIAGVHRQGLHVTLYIEGYIVHKESELAKSGKAEQWSVMHKDGSITGPYTQQGFFHMCPGCAAWQDHLAATAARLLRETGADGIRLDSLGFYFLSCYNPAHHHASPFGYNEWMKELLAKVSAAALAVNPDALLTTEAPVDWYGQWFHGALTQVYPRDLPLMRLAVHPYRPIAYSQSGPVWGSISGLVGGRSSTSPDLGVLEANWLCARHPVHEALTVDEVADADPKASDPQMVTRQFRGKGYSAALAVRPACPDAVWPANTPLAPKHARYTLTLPDADARTDQAEAPKAAVCDIETLTWTPVEPERSEGGLLVPLTSNWALVVVPDRDGPDVIDFTVPPVLHPGESGLLHLRNLSAKPETAPRSVSIVAPGLKTPSAPVAVPGDAAIEVPEEAVPGLYGLTVSGDKVLSTKRFLKVE